MPTHFKNAAGEEVAITTHVHLLSEHVTAGLSAGFDWSRCASGSSTRLGELKPKWASPARPADRLRGRLAGARGVGGARRRPRRRGPLRRARGVTRPACLRLSGLRAPRRTAARAWCSTLTASSAFGPRCPEADAFRSCSDSGPAGPLAAEPTPATPKLSGRGDRLHDPPLRPRPPRARGRRPARRASRSCCPRAARERGPRGGRRAAAVDRGPAGRAGRPRRRRRARRGRALPRPRPRWPAAGRDRVHRRGDELLVPAGPAARRGRALVRRAARDEIAPRLDDAVARPGAQLHEADDPQPAHALGIVLVDRRDELQLAPAARRPRPCSTTSSGTRPATCASWTTRRASGRSSGAHGPDYRNREWLRVNGCDARAPRLSDGPPLRAASSIAASRRAAAGRRRPPTTATSGLAPRSARAISVSASAPRSPRGRPRCLRSPATHGPGAPVLYGDHGARPDRVMPDVGPRR